MVMLMTDRSHLPSTVTSYDVWKTLAVILMIVDHIGVYFFPDDSMWRAVGRLCVPIWFFLIGYASSRDMSWRLWAGALIVCLSNLVVGLPILPLNILATIIVVRWVLNPFMAKALQSLTDGFMACLVVLLCFIPASFVFEYGTVGLALASLGYVARNRKVFNLDKEKTFTVFFLALLFYVATQAIGFGFALRQAVFMGVGSFIIGAFLLYGFKPAILPKKSILNTPVIRAFLQFFGRYTLEIYVVHLILFKGIAMALGTVDASAWDFRLFESL